MKRPSYAFLDELDAVIKDIHDAEDTLQFLRNRIEEIVVGIGAIEQNRDKLAQVASYLYWMVPEVKPAAIAQAVIGTPNIQRLIKQLPEHSFEILCDCCSSAVSFKSRSQAQVAIRTLRKNYPRYGSDGYRVLCGPCQEELYKRRKAESDAYSARYDSHRRALAERQKELQEMLYREYLQTPEWKARRQHHLKSAGFRCQLCNASGSTLNVHHRTYVRRGAEQFKDLVVLCHDCHEIFHRERKLSHD